jgi:hypothetical protein
MNFVNAFQKIGLTVTAFLAVVLFGGGFFMSTINPAKADNPTTVNNTGKIMMDQVNVTKDGKSFYHTLVWDTESGKSKMYYLSFTESTWKVASNQLPSSPLY